jgi:hypothetical protein
MLGGAVMGEAYNKTRLWTLLGFAAIEAVLFVLIQVTGGYAFRAFCYAAVVLAFIFSLTFISGVWDRIILTVGLAFTLAADFYLVLLDDHYAVAVSFFSLAQIAYAARLCLRAKSGKSRRIQLLTRGVVSLSAILVPCFLLGEQADYLSVIVVFYFANLVLNTVIAFFDINGDRAFGIGLLLFCLCDAVIGLSKLGMYFPVGDVEILKWLSHYGYKIAWMFYVPSQTLIALSLLPERLKNINASRRVMEH